MSKRTAYGIEILGKIKGFKNFLETAEKEKLEALVLDDPKYFYNILPYTYVLDISDKWIKKFETIGINEPDWYVSNTPFNYIVMSNFMHNTLNRVQRDMISTPNSSGGSYGSGGGFSVEDLEAGAEALGNFKFKFEMNKIISNFFNIKHLNY